MNLVQNKTIAIVGGGPGGLTLARLLQMKGVKVNVYERDLNREARVQGATLDLHEESGLRAIRAAGLTAAFEANYRPGADLIRILDKTAKIVFDEHAPEQQEALQKGIDYPVRPEIDRGPLRNILLDSLNPGTVQWNHRFRAIAASGNGWTLVFENAAVAYADIVIAADGANSKLRSYLTDILPGYSGVTAIEGVVYDAARNAPHIDGLLKGGKIFAMGDEKSIIVSAKGDGSIAFYTGAKTEENWYRQSGIDFADRAQLIGWFDRDFPGWDPIWKELLSAASLPLWPRPQYCIPFNQTWEAWPNLTLIGDAAHLMPPYAGEGVNMAMLDALELAGCLTGAEYLNSREAIARYEMEMRRRAAETAAMTMENTEGLHSADGIAFMLGMFGAA